jgi:uroporphyrinogen decarboxylase
MQTMLLAPDVAEELFRERTRWTLAAVEQYLELGIDQIGVGGDFAGNRPIISAEAYRRFIVPEVRKVVDRIHRSGAYAVNASDGDLWYVIDDFLTGCDADGYIEIDGQAGMDLGRLKERFGRRVTFYGNFDCMKVLCFASPQDVRRHAIATIEAGLGDGGHILCANNAITSAVPVENYVALQQAYRDYFGLPRLKL